MKQPIFRPAAAADVEEAFLWYESQRPSLGEEFLAATRAALDAVTENPLQYPVIYRQTRRILLHRFPYGLFYRLLDEEIIVVAVMHARRNPRRWKSRH